MLTKRLDFELLTGFTVDIVARDRGNPHRGMQGLLNIIRHNGGREGGNPINNSVIKANYTRKCPRVTYLTPQQENMQKA